MRGMLVVSSILLVSVVCAQEPTETLVYEVSVCNTNGEIILDWGVTELAGAWEVVPWSRTIGDLARETGIPEDQFRPFGVCDPGDLRACAEHAQKKCSQLELGHATEAKHIQVESSPGSGQYETACQYCCKQGSCRLAQCIKLPQRPPTETGEVVIRRN